jgi:hypothetical protein
MADTTLLIERRHLTVRVSDVAGSTRIAAGELRALLGRIEATFRAALKESELVGDTAADAADAITYAIEELGRVPGMMERHAEGLDGERPAYDPRREHGLLLSEVL